MKFVLTFASAPKGQAKEITCNSLKELEAISKEYEGKSLIVTFSDNNDGEHSIVVYDDWIE